MKSCNLVYCDKYHEVYCIMDLKECKEKTDADLITEREFNKLKSKEEVSYK